MHLRREDAKVKTTVPFLLTVLVVSLVLVGAACNGEEEQQQDGTADAAEETSQDGTEEVETTTDTDEETDTGDGLCAGACAEGEICVYAQVGDTEPSCVDPTTAYWDDGTDPAKRLIEKQDGWYRKRLDAWEELGARCNDGSPYAYYFRKGQDDGANRWLLYFKGGGGCLSEDECAMRWLTQHNLMTSTGEQFYPTKGDNGREKGIYARDEESNPFRNWNMVHIYYCSSDSFLGTVAPPESPLGLWFRGQAIVEGMMQELIDGFDTSEVGIDLPSISQAELVVIGGGSAGATAARVHMDRLASLIKASNANVTVYG